MINVRTLQNVFLAISKKQLEYVYISLSPTLDETTSGEDLQQLQHTFN
jgi:hypothetical protein